MGIAYNPKIVTDGLVLCLDAANPKSYPGSGATWFDLSGNNNNGTLVNNPSVAGGSVTFNYLNSQQVNFSSAPSLQFLNRAPYTLEAWVYPTRNPDANNWTGIFDRESNLGSGRDGYNLYFLGSATTETYFSSDRWATGTLTIPSILVDSSQSVNNWNHIVVTYDGTNVAIYRNSVLGQSIASTGNITNNVKTLNIGVRGGQFFDGNVSNAKIYSKALSIQEIQQNFNAARGRFGI